MDLMEAKKAIAHQTQVEYQGHFYTVTAITMRVHHKEVRWYYQLELMDVRAPHSLVIADLFKTRYKTNQCNNS
jgi:hypothetical protein